jgi:integrating conjugative element protein (TIGR03749 family)
MIKVLLTLITLLTFNCANANVRLLNVQGEPIKLDLVVGQEVQLNFENHLGSIGKPGLIANKLETQLIDSRLWIKATDVFKPIKVLIKSEKGKISIILLSAHVSKQKIQQYPLKYNIVAEKKSQSRLPKTSKKSEHNLNIKTKLSYIDLTRFAAQSLYSPIRLVKNINLVRVPINTEKTVNLFACSHNLACNGNVSATPIAAWKSSHYYISAILLKNNRKKLVVLDPRDLIGNWKSATFHFNRIGRVGSSTDTSVVYLVSSSSFEQSL